MLTVLFKLFARLPLGFYHALGIALGWLAYAVDSTFASRIRANLLQSGLAKDQGDYSRLLRSSIAELGKGFMELVVAWGRSPRAATALVRSCRGWEHVDTALQANRPILFVSPHLGCYDIAGRYLASHLPNGIMAMYRPPKLAWLEPLMNAGRARGDATTVPATGSGVRQMFKHLKQGGCAFILPDQVPGEGGDGVWAPFFGKPAYTMTLVPRLAGSADALVLMTYGRRLPWGRGYELVLVPLAEGFSGEREADAVRLNRAVEDLVRLSPSQYLWSYNRYKHPAGAPQSGETV